MPRVEELVNHLGRAHFILLDLTKVYRQVSLSPEGQPKMAFSTTSGSTESFLLASMGCQQLPN